MAHKWAGWLHYPCHLGCPRCFRVGEKTTDAHKWAMWLHNPGCFSAGDKIRSGPQVRLVAE